MEKSAKLMLLILLLIGVRAFAQAPRNKVIYGHDDRKDWFEITNPATLQLADSTVALMRTSDLNQTASGSISIKALSLQKSWDVCNSEPYFDQPTGAFCSGTLIGSNLILTAGHCIVDQNACNSTKFVFGYDVTEKGKYPTEARESEVYGCKSIVHREQNLSGADFGIIETDREVVGHLSLKIADRSNSTIANGTKLLMIGHPSGLPTKIDDGGRVRDSSPNGFFRATTDSYGGNSGSAIFSQDTYEIEGVLVNGATDYVLKDGCYVSNVCAEDGCIGEGVTKIASISPFMPERH